MLINSLLAIYDSFCFLFDNFLGNFNFEELTVMPSSKLQNQRIPTKQSTNVKQKINQPKNVKQKTSKTPQPTYDENQKKRRTSPNPKHGKAVEVESGYHEEEELGSNLDPAEIQGSEVSSDKSEASSIQSEQSVNKESVKAKPRRGAFPVQSPTSSEEDEGKEEENSKDEDKEKTNEEEKTEEKNGKKGADATEIVSDGNENELIKKDTKNLKKIGGQCGQCLNLSEKRKETKDKMFKKFMAKKQADKEERPRTNTEKHKLAKEIKQKAKGKKKKKEENGDEPSPVTEEGQPSKDFSHSDLDSPTGKNRLLKKTKFVKERDSVEVDDSNEEKEEDEPITTKSITDQSPKSLVKASRKDLKVTPEPDEQRNVKSVIKEKPQRLLLNKVRMASLGHKAGKRGLKCNEDILECDSTEMASSKCMKPVIAQHKKATALRRVSGWIQKKIPQLNFRKKFSILTKAIGVSHWLSSRAIKPKHGTRKTKGNLLKHRMAMRVASRTSLTNLKCRNSSEDEGGKDKSNLQGKTKDNAGKVLQGEDKDLEAKFAVVLPRMNETSKAKTDQKPSSALGSSTSPCPAGELSAESKTPKPGAKFVLPVKPDLSLLKSTRKMRREGFMADTDVTKRIPESFDASEDSFKLEGRTKNFTMKNQDGISVLQAARGKLKPSQINLSKLPMGKTGNGQSQLRRPDTGREEAAGTPRSITKHVPKNDTRAAISAVCPLYEEETDKEVAQFMGEAGLYMISQPEVHWTGNPRMSGNPQVCVVNLVLSSWLNKSTLSIFSHLSDKPAKYNKRGSYESKCISQHFAMFGTGLAPVRKSPATSDGGEANQVDSL